jgi:hypothetical protein
VSDYKSAYERLFVRNLNRYAHIFPDARGLLINTFLISKAEKTVTVLLRYNPVDPVNPV